MNLLVNYADASVYVFHAMLLVGDRTVDYRDEPEGLKFLMTSQSAAG